MDVFMFSIYSSCISKSDFCINFWLVLFSNLCVECVGGIVTKDYLVYSPSLFLFNASPLSPSPCFFSLSRSLYVYMYVFIPSFHYLSQSFSFLICLILSLPVPLSLKILSSCHSMLVTIQ